MTAANKEWIVIDHEAVVSREGEEEEKEKEEGDQLLIYSAPPQNVQRVKCPLLTYHLLWQGQVGGDTSRWMFGQAGMEMWFFKEAVMLLKLALPLCLWCLLQELPFFISLLFVGHFSGSQELSATALGSAVVNLSGVYVILGMAMAADTLCPQSYGFRNYKRVGVILQRGLLILSIACVPIAIVWLNSESILLFLRQVPCVVRLTGRYTRIFILALPGMVLYTMLQKYMQAQSLVWVFVGIGLIINVFLVLFCALFIVGAKLGTIGASLVVVLAYTLSPVLLMVYIYWRKFQLQTWGGWSFEGLTEWWQFMRLSLSGLLMVAFEWWSFEISALVTGSISELELATNSILLQLTNLTYTLALGMASAVNVRVGNELGAGNVTSAKRSSFVALSLISVLACIISVLIFALRREVGKIFTSEINVVEAIADAMLGAIGIVFFDQIQGVLWGIMRACGRQVTVAAVCFICYWLIGLPLGIMLALVLELNTKGMWIGISLAGGIQTCILSTLVVTSNWKKFSEKAMRDAGGNGCVAAGHASSAFFSTQEDSHLMDPSNMKLTSFGGDENQCSDHQGHPFNFAHLMHEDRKEEESEVLFPLAHPTEKEDEDLEESVVALSSECTEIQICQNNCGDGGGGKGGVGRTKLLYNSSSRLCQSKSSILMCRGLTLLVCVALLLGGVLMAVTIHHHPVDCDQEKNMGTVGSR